jgi:phosphate-selective porin OprO/OprP
VPPRDGLGYYVQAGFLIPRQPLELTARWGQIIGLGGPQRTSLPDSEEIGGGFNWYIARHSLKVQTDYFRTRSDAYDSGAVAFHSVPWRDGADLFRIHLQLAF